MTTRDLMRELRLLGQADIPKNSLERVWLRVLRECSTAEAAEAGATCPKIAAEGPLVHGGRVLLLSPGLRAGTSLPGLRPVRPLDTPTDDPRSGSPALIEGDDPDAA